MIRRIDYITAEKVSLALLIRAEFGLDAAVRFVPHLHLPKKLVADVFSRQEGMLRANAPRNDVMCGRRQADRRDTKIDAPRKSGPPALGRLGRNRS